MVHVMDGQRAVLDRAATPLAEVDGDALRIAGPTSCATQVEHLAPTSEHRRDHTVGRGQTPGFGDGERCAVDQGRDACCVEAVEEGRGVDDRDDPRSSPPTPMTVGPVTPTTEDLDHRVVTALGERRPVGHRDGTVGMLATPQHVDGVVDDRHQFGVYDRVGGDAQHLHTVARAEGGDPAGGVLGLGGGGGDGGADRLAQRREVVGAVDLGGGGVLLAAEAASAEAAS